MIGAVAALALMSGLFQSPGRDVQVRRYQTAGWRLTVRQNHFTGLTACTIERRNVVFAEGVVTFHFGHRVDTANAEFRIGDAPPRVVGSVAVEAAGLGARFNGPNLGNPSNGEVHIPADLVDQAQLVSIKPNRKMNHRTFNLTGLSTAVEMAKAQRCDDLTGRARLDTPISWRLLLPVAMRPHKAIPV